MAYCVALVTVPDTQTGQKIARLLVEKKLAACVNHIEGLESTYWWQGKIETAREALLIIKTEKTRFKELVKAVKENHPLEVPEIISLPIKEGNRDYLKWIAQSVGIKKEKPRTKAKKNRAKKQSIRDKKKNAKAKAKALSSSKKG